MRPANPSLDLADFEKLGKKAKLKVLVQFAALAPSSHNTQPWLFRLGEDSIAVLLNEKRVLPVSDPTGRQAYISIGTAIQNLLTAADYFGYEHQLQINDRPAENLAAVISLREGKPKPQAKTLAQAILTRHNNRFPYDKRTPENSLLELLGGFSNEFVSVHIISDQARKKEISEIVGNALEEALNDKQFRFELSHWIKSASNKHADGMTGDNLAMPAVVAAIFPTILRNFKVGRFQKAMESKALRSTSVFIILTAENDNKISWINSGMVLEKIALACEEQSAKTAMLAAAIEIADYHKELQRVLDTKSRPEVFMRLGFTGKTPKQAPRLSIEQVILE